MEHPSEIKQSKQKPKKITDIDVINIINKEFDELEDWVEEEMLKIKNKCIDDYNNFSEIVGKRAERSNKNEGKNSEKEYKKGDMEGEINEISEEFNQEELNIKKDVKNVDEIKAMDDFDMIGDYYE